MAAIVTATMAVRRRRNRTAEEEQLEGHLALPAKQLLERMEKLVDIIEDEQTGKTFGFGGEVSDHSQSQKKRCWWLHFFAELTTQSICAWQADGSHIDRSKHVDGLLARVEDQIVRSTQYR